MQNLTAQLQFHARQRPQGEALVYNDLRLTWAELDIRVQTIAGGLRDRGIGPDSIVALVMKNSAAFIELFYAISHVGAVILPVNYRLSAEELEYIITHAGVDLVLADEEFADALLGLKPEVLLVDAAAQNELRSLFGNTDPVRQPNPRQSNDLLRLMYTSGTTDRPKGVTHNYENFIYKNMDMIIALQLSADDRLCMVGPLYHVGGCDLPGMAVHTVGGTLVVLRDFDPRQVVQTIARERITGVWFAPVMTSAILELDQATLPDLSSLQWCIAGGERTPEARIRGFSAVFPCARYVDAYGMTETVSGDTLMEPGREIEKIGSVGRSVSMVELEIRDGDGVRLGPGEPGEICMRGPKVTRGYWKDPERTRDAMFDDGFLRSGDVGYLDDEGFLFLTDRKKDMIISGGENIASSEIERVLYLMPEIAETAVVAQPHDKWGEVPLAVVVLRDGASLTVEDMIDFCRQHLAGFKCPRNLAIVDELPRNPSGKILKRLLRDQILK